MPTYEHEGVIARFPDALSGISISSLLANTGSFHLRLCGDAGGELFTLRSPGYRIELVVSDGAVEFRRNAHRARLQIGPVGRSFQIRVSWEPDWFRLALAADDRIGAEAAPVCVHTEPIFVPRDLTEWARRLNLLPRAVYSSRAEFLGVFLECLRQTGRAIRDASCQGLFWDEQRRRLGGTRLRPKREPEAMSGLAAFLQDQSIRFGFELAREPAAGAGSVQYRASGRLASGGHATVCLEGGNAHAPELGEGISDRLPACMEHAGADYGIYLVLWYRCHAFRYPRSNPVHMMWDLTNRIPWGNIVVESLDLAMPGASGIRRGAHG